MRNILQKLANKKVIVPICFAVFVLFIILPPIIHGYVYFNNGDDTAMHLQFFENLKQGHVVNMLYLGQLIVGYPIAWVSTLTGISVNALFLWFNYGVLCLVGFSFYLLITELFNWKVGLLSLPIMLLACPSIMDLFNCGSTFDIITIGILFPLCLLCIIKAIKNKFPWSIYVVALFALAVSFHSIGIFNVGQGVINPTGSLGDVATAVSSGVAKVATGTNIMQAIIAPLVSSAWGLFILGVALILPLCIFCIVLIGRWRKDVSLNIKQKVVFVILAIVIICLSIPSFTTITSFSMRFAIDLSIVVALLFVCIVGVVLQSSNNRKLAIRILLVIICVGSIPMMIWYYGYHSAITQADKDAIAYVNTLSGDYYSCSPEISPWIYNQFLNKTYKEGALPYIQRNEPMSGGTIPDAPYYWYNEYYYKIPKPMILQGLPNVKEFTDGQIIIEVEP